MDKFIVEERKLMDEILREIHEYIDEMKETANKEGKDFKSFLSDEDFFIFVIYTKPQKIMGRILQDLNLGLLCALICRLITAIVGE